jgi:small conductance mechanosensitive channel
MGAGNKRSGGWWLILAVASLLVSARLTFGQAALLSAASAADNNTAALTVESQSHLQLTAILRGSGAELKWNCDLPGIAQYSIQRSEHGLKNFVEVTKVSGEVSSYVDAATHTAKIDYRVQALDSSGKILDTSATVSPLQNNLLNIFSGGKLELQDMQDMQFWRDSVNSIVIETAKFIPRLFSAVILFGLFWVVYRIVRRIIMGSMARAKVDPSIRDMLGALLRWAILGFALVIACDQIGIQIAALLTGVSIIGLAIGFAAQETLANFIAGIVIFWDKPFRVGDWIVIDNNFGKVLRVSFRSTRMLNLTGETVVMPNTYMLANRVANHSTHPMIRVEVPIGIAYKESIDEARSALLATASGDSRICTDPPPTVVVSACADSSVNLLLRLWTHDEAEERTIFYDYLERAKKALDAAGIEIPFPHVQLMLENGNNVPPGLAAGRPAPSPRLT